MKYVLYQLDIRNIICNLEIKSKITKHYKQTTEIIICCVGSQILKFDMQPLFAEFNMRKDLS